MLKQAHIEMSRNETDGFQTTYVCLLCGDKCFISDYADAKAFKSNEQWFIRQHEQCGAAFKGKKVDEAKAKIQEILTSPRVASVEVGLDESFGDVRIYSAVTKETGIPHRYRVRVEDSFDGTEKVTTARCNCAGFARYDKCRHSFAVADADAKHCHREIYPFEIINRAYKTYAQSAVA